MRFTKWNDYELIDASSGERRYIRILSKVLKASPYDPARARQAAFETNASWTTTGSSEEYTTLSHRSASSSGSSLSTPCPLTENGTKRKMQMIDNSGVLSCDPVIVLNAYRHITTINIPEIESRAEGSRKDCPPILPSMPDPILGGNRP